MTEDQKLHNELKRLPKPNLQREKQDEMHQYILNYDSKHGKRKGWKLKMKKTYTGIATAVALISLSFVSYNIFTKNAEPLDQSGSQFEEKLEPSQESILPAVENPPIDSNEINLDEHQVAIGDLYFEIPMRKNTVFIDRRIEGEFIIVDIRDKNTNELLYRFGETQSDSKEKMVFREVNSEINNTKISLNVSLEIDSINGLIHKVNKPEIVFEQPPKDPNDYKFIDSLSMSGKFPAEKIQTVAHFFITHKIESKVSEKKNEVEEIYEGFILGVIKKN